MIFLKWKTRVSTPEHKALLKEKAQKTHQQWLDALNIKEAKKKSREQFPDLDSMYQI